MICLTVALSLAACGSDDQVSPQIDTRPSAGEPAVEPAPKAVDEPVRDGPIAADAATETAGRATTQASTVPGRGYDLQGHRGARGLRPENTLPAFELALDLMVDTLEFDLHLSADDVVVVWHDPVIDADKCNIEAATPIRQMDAAELSEIRCDRNPDPGRFPEQMAEAGTIAGDDYTLATLQDVFAFVETYAASPTKTEAQRANAASVGFNIETKRQPGDPSAIGDGFDGVTVGPFESVVMQTAISAGVLDRVTVQSFDHRSLWAIHAVDPEVTLAALTRLNDIPDFADLAEQGAAVWSPDYRSVSDSTLAAAHDSGLRVVPWTVNDPADMTDLLDRGVDGFITDRPDLVPLGP